jgi:ribonuclease HII
MLAARAAKVTRDRLMEKLAKEYPHYGFEGHKGYGTKAHMEAIRTHGVSVIHRQSFIHID